MATVFEADRRAIAEAHQLSQRLADDQAAERLCRSFNEWHGLVVTFWLATAAAERVLEQYDDLQQLAAK
jgi:hypothetical protein